MHWLMNPGPHSAQVVLQQILFQVQNGRARASENSFMLARN